MAIRPAHDDDFDAVAAITNHYIATTGMHFAYEQVTAGLLQAGRAAQGLAVDILRSGVIGVIIGAIPGVGEDVASWVSYDFAKRSSKKPEEFGKGSLEGLIAAETGDNACIGGAIIPVLSLAVPGSAPAAVLLAAMWLHGVRPGPLLMFEFPNYIWEVTAMMIMASFASLVISLSFVKAQVKILLIPRAILMPIVFVFCVIGSFAINARIFDIWVMFGFGILGYVMRNYNYPAAPLVLGVILGDMADVNMRRALIPGGREKESLSIRRLSP